MRFKSGLGANIRLRFTSPYSVREVNEDHTNKALDEIPDRAFTIAGAMQRNKLESDALGMARDEYSSIPLLERDLVLGLNPKVGDITSVGGGGGVTIMGLQFETITHPK